MSEATRAIALQHAVQHHAGKVTDAGNVVDTAHRFLNFIDPVSAEATDPAPAKPATAARLAAAASAKPPAAKPAAAVAKKPSKTEDQLAKEAIDKAAAEAEAETEGPTKEAIGQAVEDLLKANLRTQAVALLKKHGAKSVSEVPEESYQDFIDEANTLLMSA